MRWEPGQSKYAETSSPAPSRIDELLPCLKALRNRCQSVTDFDKAAAAVHESLVRGIRMAAAELDKRLGAVEGLLAIAADPVETGYLFELKASNLSALLDIAVARKGADIVTLCIALRPWLAPPTPAELLAHHLNLGPLAGRRSAGGYGCFETSVTRLCEENPWLEPVHKELHRLAGTAGPAEATGDLADSPSVPLFCRVANLALELMEAAARLVRRPWTSEERARLYEDDYWDKPRSDTAMRARDRRYAGWPEPVHRSRFRPAMGNDLDSKIQQSVLGINEETYLQAWGQIDERIYKYKRGVPRRAYVGGSDDDRPVSTPDFTNAFGAAAVRRVYNAFAFANRTGRIMNAQLTIAWYLLEGVDPAAQWQCFDTFYHNIKQWFRNVSSELVPEATDRRPWIVYVHENPGGHKLHTHFALVVPDPLIERFYGCAKGILWRALPASVNDLGLAKLVRLRVRRTNHHAYVGQWFWFHYILKGANHSEVVAKGGVDGTYPLGDVMAYRYQDPGPMRPRQRIGFTASLRPKAQKAFVDDLGRGFESLWEQQMQTGRVDVRELYFDRYFSHSKGCDDAPDASVRATAVPGPEEESDPLAILIMWPWAYRVQNRCDIPE